MDYQPQGLDYCTAYTKTGNCCKNRAIEGQECCRVHGKISSIQELKLKFIEKVSETTNVEEIYSALDNNSVIHLYDSDYYQNDLKELKIKYHQLGLQGGDDIQRCFVQYFKSIFSFVSEPGNELARISIINCVIDFYTIRFLRNMHYNLYTDDSDFNPSEVKAINNLIKQKNKLIGTWTDDNRRRIAVKELCKIPYIADDICKYVIAEYL